MSDVSDLIVFDSVTDAVQITSGKAPDHPLIHVMNLADTHVPESYRNARICCNLYQLVLKRNNTCQVRYGRRQYDFACGVIGAYAPGQVMQVDEAYRPGDLEGWSLIFHPDLLLQHPLGQRIQQYGFFSYDVCEALHASEREQQVLNRLVDEVRSETRQNLDEFSLGILLSSIELLLTYTDRFFNRQFLTRKPYYQDSVERFKALVDEHLEQASLSGAGLPSVKQLAAEMNMSPNYMSDLLRKYTGNCAQELIHLQLVEKAKYRLLNTNDSVSTIAYQLGFEYPQYFSRIFKKKTAMSPQDFRKLQ
ncbi:helix-turn-helix domain-containing protein [Parendozoicomonas haliclonae]|uniref:HTH-type transcriptional activator Btr n=1 Tax=Parendozoicomonas haliclonae TaxID=1960125 RepID=A0A1X7AMD6_9GAMM|nr:AraC family transcriptional regulator [Parendozoicomonas haliclonae]SMA49070.1 HTH-type transcriptional activator Btr [Parendozoicomonas haliclonae]